MKRYAIYRRVSTDEQSRPGHVSLEAQTAECRRLVIEHGGVVVLEEQDVQSGLDPSRPGYQRLRDAARQGEIDAVVCFRFDRWGRNAGEAITSFTDLQSIGVTVESVMEPSEDIFLKSLFSLLGFRESQAISQRTVSGLRTRARRGEWSGHPPIGYTIRRDNGRSVLATDPLKAPAVRQLFEDAATGRYSLAQLADAAMAAGLRGPNGHPISRQYVGRLLRNPTYVGALVYGRTSNGKFAKRGKQPTDTWIETPDAHPALVDQATFTSVQMHLTRHRNEQGSIRRTRFLLTSIAYCGRCAGVPGPNGKARAWRVYGHGTKSPGYQCSRRSMYGLCDLPNLGAIGIELAVRQRIMRAFTFTPEVRQEAAAFIAAEINERRSTVEQQRRNLAQSLEQHKRKRVELARRLMDNVIPEDIYQAMEREEADAVAQIERTLITMPPEPERSNIEPILDALAVVDFDDLDFEDWRELVVLVISRVLIYGPGEDFKIEFQPAADVVRRAIAKLSGFGSRRLG